MSDIEDTAFYRSIFRVGGFYFTFKDDTRELLDMQPYSKIGRGRTVNVVRMDESGTSYKQYSKKGVFDSDRDSVIDDINFRLSKRSKQRTKFVFAIIFFVLSGFFIVASIITSFMFGIADAVEMMFGEGGGVFFAVVLLIGILLFLSATKIRKPYLLYDITPEREKELKAFYNEISKFDESEKIWLVNTTDRHNDPKRNAGATSNVSRSEENYHHLSFIDGIETNVFIPSIGRRLYFFPDVLLISKREEIKPVFYDKIEIILSTTQFSEQGEIPSDSEEISSSWLYVNLDGSPDRRRKENRKIPIVKYGDIRIKSNDGSLSRIMTSNYEIGQTVANTLHNYKPKT